MENEESTNPSERILYENPHYRITDNNGFAITSASGEVLIAGFVPSLTRAETYAIAAPIINANVLEIDHTHGLAAGDAIEVINFMYGGAARLAFRVAATIEKVSLASITLTNDLPGHITRYSKGVFVCLRQPREQGPGAEFVEIANTADGADIVLAASVGPAELTLTAHCKDLSSRIDFDVGFRSVEPCRLEHLSLAVQSAVPIQDLYLKNRALRDATGQKRPVWLWKEGVRAASPTAAWMCLHNPEIACAELVVGAVARDLAGQAKPTLVLNLEHESAQHFRRHRERFDIDFSTFEELSLPSFEAGDARTYRFSIHAGNNLPAPPRLSLTPGGARATHVWTEHADKASIETQRAAYFGNQAITTSSQATGGFVGHGHVVTKSVFYDNPRGFPNEIVVDGVVKKLGAMLAMKESPEFATMLDELKELGHEICAHAARPYPEHVINKAHRIGTEAIYSRFRSPTWIDHALESIQYAIGFQGAKSYSHWRMLDLWNEYKVRYFWTWSSSDFMPKKPNGINLLHLEGGEAKPTPMYWQHPKLGRDIYIWGANECHLDAFSEQTIDELIQDRGVSVHQHYYPFVVDERYPFNFIETDENGAYRATNQFNATLATMAKKRDEGELHIATIGEMMDYWTALEKVRWQAVSPNSFEIENTANKTIRGFAFIVECTGIDSNAKAFDSRPLDNGDRLVWLDLNAGERCTFRLDDENAENECRVAPAAAKPKRKLGAMQEIDWLLDAENGFVAYFRPRCGSTTITRWFFENMGVKFSGFSISGYRSEWLLERIDDLEETLERRYDTLHKFVVIRNPIERVVSSYLHVVNNPADSQWVVVKPYVDEALTKHDLTFRQWVDYLGRIDLDACHIIWRRQSALSCWDRGVDDVVTLENMNDYLLRMNQRFGLSAKPGFNSVTVADQERVRILDGDGSTQCFADMPFHQLLQFKDNKVFRGFPDYSQFFDEDLSRRVDELYRADIEIYRRHSS